MEELFSPGTAPEPGMPDSAPDPDPLGISVNGVPIPDERVRAAAPGHEDDRGALREAGHELVLRELLRQRALALGIDAPDPGTLAQAVFDAEVSSPGADADACLRFYEQHPLQFREGDSVEASHILFQLTPRVDVFRLRARGGEILDELIRAGDDKFPEFAARYSNCPSGKDGGSLGRLRRGDTVPEFEKPVFEMPAWTLATRLIETRYGFHIVRTGHVEQGHALPFEQVRDSIAAWLEHASRRRAMHQYLRQLVGQADIRGIHMDGDDSPLTQ
jgi:peptidyl-prolyl cis-trans isomerase C